MESDDASEGKAVSPSSSSAERSSSSSGSPSNGGASDGGRPAVAVARTAEVLGAPWTNLPNTTAFFQLTDYIASVPPGETGPGHPALEWRRPTAAVDFASVEVQQEANIKFVAIDDDHHQPVDRDGDRVFPVAMGRFYNAVDGSLIPEVYTVCILLMQASKEIKRSKERREEAVYQAAETARQSTRASEDSLCYQDRFKGAKFKLKGVAERCKWSGDMSDLAGFLRLATTLDDHLEYAFTALKGTRFVPGIFEHGLALVRGRVEKVGTAAGDDFLAKCTTRAAEIPPPNSKVTWWKHLILMLEVADAVNVDLIMEELLCKEAANERRGLGDKIKSLQRAVVRYLWFVRHTTAYMSARDAPSVEEGDCGGAAAAGAGAGHGAGSGPAILARDWCRLHGLEGDRFRRACGADGGPGDPPGNAHFRFQMGRRIIKHLADAHGRKVLPDGRASPAAKGDPVLFFRQYRVETFDQLVAMTTAKHPALSRVLMAQEVAFRELSTRPTRGRVHQRPARRERETDSSDDEDGPRNRKLMRRQRRRLAERERKFADKGRKTERTQPRTEARGGAGGGSSKHDRDRSRGADRGGPRGRMSERRGGSRGNGRSGGAGGVGSGKDNAEVKRRWCYLCLSKKHSRVSCPLPAQIGDDKAEGRVKQYQGKLSIRVPGLVRLVELGKLKVADDPDTLSPAKREALRDFAGRFNPSHVYEQARGHVLVSQLPRDSDDLAPRDDDDDVDGDTAGVGSAFYCAADLTDGDEASEEEVAEAEPSDEAHDSSDSEVDLEELYKILGCRDSDEESGDDSEVAAAQTEHARPACDTLGSVSAYPVMSEPHVPSSTSYHQQRNRVPTSASGNPSSTALDWVAVVQVALPIMAVTALCDDAGSTTTLLAALVGVWSVAHVVFTLPRVLAATTDAVILWFIRGLRPTLHARLTQAPAPKFGPRHAAVHWQREARRERLNQALSDKARADAKSVCEGHTVLFADRIREGPFTVAVDPERALATVLEDETRLFAQRDVTVRRRSKRRRHPEAEEIRPDAIARVMFIKHQTLTKRGQYGIDGQSTCLQIANVPVGGRRTMTKTLFDTGADLSLISLDALTRILPGHTLIRDVIDTSHVTNVQAVSGAQLTLGRATLTMEVDGVAVPHSLNVMRAPLSDDFAMLLGTDFHRRFEKTEFDWQAGTVSFWPFRQPTPLTVRTQQSRLRAPRWEDTFRSFALGGTGPTTEEYERLREEHHAELGWLQEGCDAGAPIQHGEPTISTPAAWEHWSFPDERPSTVELELAESEVIPDTSDTATSDTESAFMIRSWDATGPRVRQQLDDACERALLRPYGQRVALEGQDELLSCHTARVAMAKGNTGKRLREADRSAHELAAVRAKLKLAEESVERFHRGLRQSAETIMSDAMDDADGAPHGRFVAVASDGADVAAMTKDLIKLKPGTRPTKGYSRKYQGEIGTWAWQTIQEMKRLDIVSPSSSPWDVPLLIVPKRKNGLVVGYRMVFDCRQLNAVTEPMFNSPPTVWDVLHALRDKKYLSDLDLAAGYYQAGLQLEDRPKTAFTVRTQHGTEHLEMNVASMGLVNAQACFIRMVNKCMEEELGKTIFTMSDDVTIATDTIEEHIRVLKKLAAQAAKHNFRFSKKKCKFGLTRLVKFGYVVGDGEIRIDPARAEAIASFDRPTNAKEVRVWLGAVQYFRPLIKDCASICRPLTALLAKDVPFVWTAAQEAAFTKTKEILSSDIVMSAPDPTKTMYVDTDAGPDGIGAVLYQLDDAGKRRAIWYLSRTLKPYELLYSTTEKELLAITYAMDKLHSIIGIGADVVVSTDARNVVWLFERTASPGVSDFRVQNWLMRLQSVPNMTIRHIPAERNGMGDALSRAVRGLNTPAARRSAAAAGHSSNPADDAERTDDVTLGLSKGRRRLYERAVAIDKARGKIDIKGYDFDGAGITVKVDTSVETPPRDRDPNYLDKEFYDALPEPRYPNRLESKEPGVSLRQRGRVLYLAGAKSMPERIPPEQYGPAGGAGGAVTGADVGGPEGVADDGESSAPGAARTPVGVATARQLSGQWVAMKYGASGWYKGWVIQPYSRHRRYFGRYTVLVEGDRTPLANTTLAEATEGKTWVRTTPPEASVAAVIMANVAAYTQEQADAARARDAKKKAVAEARARRKSGSPPAPSAASTTRRKRKTAKMTKSDKQSSALRAKRVGRLDSVVDITRVTRFPSYAEIAEEQRTVWPALWKAHWPDDDEVTAEANIDGHNPGVVALEVAQLDHTTWQEVPVSSDTGDDADGPRAPDHRTVQILMYKHDTEVDDGLHVPYMPPRYRRAALEAAHNVPMAGHRGTQATVARLRRMAWWVEHARDAHNFVRTCHECDMLRPFGARQRPNTMAWSEVRPGATIHIDFVGPFHGARTGDKWILSIIDRFSRYCMFVPLPDARHETAAKALVDNWFSTFGIPVRLISDNGKHFEGHGWRDIERHLWFRHVRTAAYAPWSNGAVERIHSTLKATLTKFCLNNNARWAEMLPQIAYAANSTVHTAHGVTPHEVMFGWIPRLPFEGVHKSDLAEARSTDPASYAAFHKQAINEAWTTFAGMDEERAHATYRASMPKHKVECFGVGDMVWRRNPTPSNPEHSLGPMRIEADVSRGTGMVYRVRDMRTGRAAQRVHRVDLRPYLSADRRGVSGRNTMCTRCGDDAAADSDDVYVCFRCPAVWHQSCATSAAAAGAAGDAHDDAAPVGSGWKCPDCLRSLAAAEEAFADEWTDDMIDHPATVQPRPKKPGGRKASKKTGTETSVARTRASDSASEATAAGGAGAGRHGPAAEHDATSDDGTREDTAERAPKRARHATASHLDDDTASGAEALSTGRGGDGSHGYDLRRRRQTRYGFSLRVFLARQEDAASGDDATSDSEADESESCESSSEVDEPKSRQRKRNSLPKADSKKPGRSIRKGRRRGVRTTRADRVGFHGAVTEKALRMVKPYHSEDAPRDVAGAREVPWPTRDRHVRIPAGLMVRNLAEPVTPDAER